ncbi:hypothetical protein [Bradyrhizobium genomosp. III]|uniref:hypothetical protein n=1 Tax=Bradyrhizobium genomosp. III TaxID=2683271 RepID=UPI0004B29CE9|nr:hypothetical protein [Bradyrhizobium sp. CCBAU 15615]
MSNVTRRALRVYAALNELKGRENDDVLDALIPFFEPILTVMDGKVFDPHVFSAGVRRLYRWRFTGDIAATFIPRLERRGILKKQARTAGGAIYTVHYSEKPVEASPALLAAFEKIIDEFEKFPPKVTDLLSYQKSRDELKDILIRFLVMMDAPGQGAFAPQLGDLEPGNAALEVIGALEEGGHPLEPNDRYMCARFVQHLMKKRPEFVPHLTRLSSIGLLAEVVEDFLKPTHVETKTDLTVILDAPIALDYLGCSGKALKDDIATIVSALKDVGASFIVLPASCVEMQHNLKSMLSLPPELRRGYTHNAMLRKEVGADFVRAVMNQPETALSSAGITVRQISLESHHYAHKYFTQEQFNDFFESITWGNNINAREHDATCATIVMRLREGRQSSDVFKTRYVLVTRNPAFVRHARNYCLQSRMITSLQEGPIVHARELATTAWLRTGLGASETIPRGHLIATCDRVLQVRPEVRNALAAQLAIVTPDRIEQLNLLMQDARSVQKLADETLNNESVVTADNAEHLLNVMREATAEELRKKHEAELQKLKEENAAAEEAYKAASRSDSERASSQLDRLTTEVALLQQRNANAEALASSQVRGVVASVNRRAKTIEIVVGGVLISLGLAGLWNVYSGALRDNPVWGAILLAFGAVGFVRVFFALLERPMPALATALNWYCRRTVSRQLSQLGLGDASGALTYKGGRIVQH